MVFYKTVSSLNDWWLRRYHNENWRGLIRVMYLFWNTLPDPPTKISLFFSGKWYYKFVPQGHTPFGCSCNSESVSGNLVHGSVLSALIPARPSFLLFYQLINPLTRVGWLNRIIDNWRAFIVFLSEFVYGLYSLEARCLQLCIKLLLGPSIHHALFCS